MRRDDAKPSGQATVYRGKERTILDTLELRRYQYTVVTGTGACQRFFCAVMFESTLTTFPSQQSR